MGQPRTGLRRPTREDLTSAADRFDLELTETELGAFETFVDGSIQNRERLEELWHQTEELVPPSRSSGQRPGPDEDPLNAVVRTCRVVGSSAGTLEGYEVGLKDNIPVAGIEMTCSSRLFEGFVPRRDATVVERLLDAGATVTAKLNMDNMARSGSGEISEFGPVLNPVDPGYLAGGSSGGSAAAVAEGRVDIALGTDQGGSVRMPASWCGVVGLKPTFGLVPYTGITSLDPSIDHVGSFARSVEDGARTLSVIAGPDGLDHRQGAVEVEDYLGGLDEHGELRVGILEEGFDRPESDPSVDETVRAAIEELADAGADVREVSVPLHADVSAIKAGLYPEGTAAMVRDDGIGRYGRGYYDVDGAIHFGREVRTNPEAIPPMMKLSLIHGEFFAREYHSRYYAMAQNLRRELSAAYDAALSEVDVLAMPTTPHGPHQVLENPSLEEVMERALSMNGNTSAFNVSGHPAISIPCGTARGLPVGCMFVGDEFEDASLLSAARELERATDNT